MEVLTAFLAFLAAAMTGLLYDRLLKSRKLKPQESQLAPTRPELRSIQSAKHNLPSSDTAFVGREKEIGYLLELLSSDNPAHLIGVDGIGGVGKTALVLEVARRCITNGSFEAIIWVSAKQAILTPEGVLPRLSSIGTLADIVQTTAYTLHHPELLRSQLSEQLTAVKAILALERTLLIVDNLETAIDRELVISFLHELPLQTKSIVTSRERLLLPETVHLYGLTHEECHKLISQELKRKGLGHGIIQEDIPRICEYAGGLPLTIKWIMALLAVYPLDSILRRLNQPDNDVARFTLEPIIAQLRGKPAHWLLLSLALIPDGSSREHVALVSGQDDAYLVEDGLAQLQELSLIDRSEDKVTMHPLVRQYLMNELAQHPDFEREARERIKT